MPLAESRSEVGTDDAVRGEGEGAARREPRRVRARGRPGFNPGELVSCMRMTPVVASAEPSGHRKKRIQVEEENCK